jgi:cobalt/nickel transport system ATP-binding protein
MVHDAVLIDLRNIHFGYPASPHLLNGLTLTLHQGERVGMIGPNGCGKTTLFHIIMGLTIPQQGSITILGKERNTQQDFIEVRQEIGFLFQDSDDQLFCPSVQDEVAFGPLNFGKTQEEVRSIIKTSLARVGLPDFETRAPYNLSGGEKRRLALATVLAMSPRVLLLDEPILGLDAATVEKVVENVTKPDLSCIVISQNKEFLKRTTNTWVTLKNGKVHPIVSL